MKTVLASILGLGVIALVAGPAAAQGPPRGFGARMGTYSGLLANESVQKELKLDEKQVEKSKTLDEKMSAEMGEKFQGLGDLEPQERRAKMMEINREISASALKAAGEFLKPEQIARLKQIAYQVRGAQSFNDPDVAKKLNITDEQKSEIEKIQRESMQEMRAIFQDAGDDREAAMKKAGELRKQVQAKIEGKLNDEQKKTWKGMVGAPFEIKYEQG
jgi:hypothetical protein